MESVQDPKVQTIDESKGLYKIQSPHGDLIGVYPTEMFSWRDNTAYWNEQEIENALLPKKTMNLNTVWWFNPTILVQDLKPQKYHVYLRDGAKEDINLPSDTSVVFQTKRMIFFTKGTVQPFNEELMGVLKANHGKLVTHYLATVDLTQFGEDPFEFKVNIQNFNTYCCKSGYFFEGAIFVPVTDSIDTPQYLLLGKDQGKIVVPTTRVPLVWIDGYQKPLPQPEPRPEHDAAFAQQQQSLVTVLQNEFVGLPHLIRPVDLFSLDSTFYREVEHTKFTSLSIKRIRDNDDEFNVLTFADDHNGLEITQAERLNVGLANTVSSSDFLSEGFEKGYWNWTWIYNKDFELVRVACLDSAHGSVDNKKIVELSPTQFLWKGNKPFGKKFSWRWWVTPNGEKAAVVTLESF